MFDLDHFKSVNDTYGHIVGDRVLQAAVRATRQVLRDGDVLVRYGARSSSSSCPVPAAAT